MSQDFRSSISHQAGYWGPASLVRNHSPWVVMVYSVLWPAFVSTS
jgi:hypothetical protein